MRRRALAPVGLVVAAVGLCWACATSRPEPPPPPPPPVVEHPAKIEHHQAEPTEAMPPVAEEAELGPGSEVVSRLVPEEDGRYTVLLHYATDRHDATPTADAPTYTGKRAAAPTLQYGDCVVTIPHIHTEGQIERPHGWQREDPKHHVVFAGARRETYESLMKQLKWETAHGIREALVFVHGYNVSFKDAAMRTAQMKFDLRFNGPALFFSWPSEAKVEEYVADEADAEWSQPDLLDFFHQLASSGAFDSIHVIAHSMGSRGTTWALNALASQHPEERALFKDLILAAPDMDADVFLTQVAPALLGQPSTWLTIYASHVDKALNYSKRLHKSKRLGDTDGGAVIVPGADVIDASAAATGFFKHSYYGCSRVLEDIHSVYAQMRPPDRYGLKAAKDYWILLPSDGH